MSTRAAKQAALDGHRGDGSGALVAAPVLYNTERIERAIEYAEPVYVGEDADVAPLAAHGLAVYPLPAGLARLAVPEAIRGAAVVLVHGNADDVRERFSGHATGLHAERIIVKRIELPAPSVADWLRAGGRVEDVPRMEELTPRFEPEKPVRISQADWLVAYARKHAEVFHGPDGETYARIPMPSGPLATVATRDRSFADWLNRAYLTTHGRVAGKDAISQVRDNLDALARLDGAREEVFVRAGRESDRVYVDMGDDSWQAVEIDARGWRIVSRPAVALRRTRGMQGLPRPEHCGADPASVQAALAPVRDFVRLPDEESYTLLFAWLIYCFSATAPFPHLSLVGEQDAGKSTAASFIRRIVDPHRPRLLQPPHSGRDLMIAAKSRAVLAFDNLSGLAPWLSDALCTLSTGGGYATRRLHTDDEEELFDLARPILTNGIDDVATRPDLASRTLMLRLTAVPKEARRSSRELEARFEQVHGQILGALFTCVSVALAGYRAHVDRLPVDTRMVEFAAWAEATQHLFPAYGVGVGEAIARNRAEGSAAAADADAHCYALRRLLEEGDGEWRGSAHALSEVLRPLLPEDLPARARLTAEGLSKHIRRMAPVLRDTGISFEDGRTKHGRFLFFSLLPK
jgi:hypothetical protein